MKNNFSIVEQHIHVPGRPDGSVVCRAKKIFSFGIGVELSEKKFNREPKEVKEVYCSLYTTLIPFTWEKLYESIKEDLRFDPCMDQEQLVDFCESHGNNLPLGQMVLFFIKEGEEIFVVTVIRVMNKQLTVYREREKLFDKYSTSRNKGIEAFFYIVIPENAC